MYSRFIAMGSSAKSSSPITTHVLNTGDGVPAARMALSLHRLDPRMAIWNLITIGWVDGYYCILFYLFSENLIENCIVLFDYIIYYSH